MQYALLIYENEEAYGSPEKNGPLTKEMFARHMAFHGELGAMRLAGAGLKGTPLATTVRTAGGKQTLHDGPFAEAKEQLGGFYIIDAPNLDAAIALARRLPLPGDGAVEIRPVLTPG
jgi:hypothetical protein